MFKNYRAQVILTCIAIMLPIAVGLAYWDVLPNSMAIHFGADGSANGWSNKYFAIFGLPCILLAVHLLCVFATLYESRSRELEPKMIRFVFWICPAASLVCAFVVYANSLGIAFDSLTVIDCFVGILFIVIGNYMPKCRQNHVVGVKLPWTLEDAENWNKTNRLAGWLFVLVGFFWISTIFTRNMMPPMYATIAAGILPCVYSPILYYCKRKKGA